MRPAILLMFLAYAVNACADSPVEIRDRTQPPISIRPDWTTETPSSEEYYEHQYPFVAETEVTLDDDVEVTAAGYACPKAIVGAEIPGNIHPYHTTAVGRLWSPLPRKRITGYSPKGIPKAEYSIMNGPWVSNDGVIAILDGVVEGWCLFRPNRTRIALGKLHVFRFEGNYIDGSTLTFLDGDNCDTAEEATYDPYESEFDECSGDGSGGGSGGGTGGSGTQYSSGDYTGGETVNWHTGIGDGGTSVCGESARVEYICIEIYNEEISQWETWSCGYATVC